jgi:hypothetical protein
MTAREQFGVGLRLVGVWFAVSALPELVALNYAAAMPGIAGLILITRADFIAQLCYPTEFRTDDWRERVPKDFRDV